MTKNDHCHALLKTADERGLVPACAVFDSWHGSLENLKPVRGPGWIWLTRVRFAGHAWTIEHHHRGIRQFRGVERAQVRATRAQRNHIGLALRAFPRLERYCYHAGISWFEAKTAIIRSAVQAYLANPLYTLPQLCSSKICNSIDYRVAHGPWPMATPSNSAAIANA